MEQARWVLSYHGIPFKRWDYTPILGETWMRAKAGKLFSMERVSAPILLIPEGNTNISQAFGSSRFCSCGLGQSQEVASGVKELKLTLYTGNIYDRVDIAKWADANSKRPEKPACSLQTSWMTSDGDFLFLLVDQAYATRSSLPWLCWHLHIHFANLQ